MKLIERPDWIDFIGLPVEYEETMDDWFDENLKDHYAVHKDDLVRVWSSDDLFAPGARGYTLQYEPVRGCTHKLYLIKSSIEPIKQETCADVLRELVKGSYIAAHGPNEVDALYDRAKAALSRERE